VKKILKVRKYKDLTKTIDEKVPNLNAMWEREKVQTMSRKVVKKPIK